MRFDGPVMVVEQLLKVTAAVGGGRRGAVAHDQLRARRLGGRGAPGSAAHDQLHHADADRRRADRRAPPLLDEAAAGRGGDARRRRAERPHHQRPVPPGRADLGAPRVSRAKPRLTEIDGPVAQYRRWYRQFYSGWQAASRDAERRDERGAALAPGADASSTTRSPTSRTTIRIRSTAGCATTRPPTTTSASTSTR